MNSEKTPHRTTDINDLTKTVIGAAYNVFNTLGFGFLESVYEKSLVIELKKHELLAKSQESIKVYYDGEIVGKFITDLLIKNIIIIELKSVSQLTKLHETQLVNYLSATGIDNGLLINFGNNGVEVKRKFRTSTK